jgi:hypothetical protein
MIFCKSQPRWDYADKRMLTSLKTFLLKRRLRREMRRTVHAADGSRGASANQQSRTLEGGSDRGTGLYERRSFISGGGAMGSRAARHGRKRVLLILKDRMRSAKTFLDASRPMSDELDKREGLFRLELDQLRLQLDQHKTSRGWALRGFGDVSAAGHSGTLHEKINGVSDAVARIEGLLEVRRKH